MDMWSTYVYIYIYINEYTYDVKLCVCVWIWEILQVGVQVPSMCSPPGRGLAHGADPAGLRGFAAGARGL